MSDTYNKQVINGVQFHSMSQEIFESLKNSEGKIPSLANCIVMTPDVGTDTTSLKGHYQNSVTKTDSSFMPIATGTTKGAILTGTITKNHANTKLLVNYSCSSFYVSGGVGVVEFQLDGTVYRAAKSDSTSAYSGISNSIVIEGIGRGAHTLGCYAYNTTSGKTVNIANNNSFQLTVVEI